MFSKYITVSGGVYSFLWFQAHTYHHFLPAERLPFNISYNQICWWGILSAFVYLKNLCFAFVLETFLLGMELWDSFLFTYYTVAPLLPSGFVSGEQSASGLVSQPRASPAHARCWAQSPRAWRMAAPAHCLSALLSVSLLGLFLVIGFSPCIFRRFCIW